MEIPSVNVGILTNEILTFVFQEEYVHKETGDILSGEQRASLISDKIMFNGKRYDELFFEPFSPNAAFELKEVTIGKSFHWEQQEDQQFKGALNLIATEEGILAINEIDVEEYLINVISSEMSATASKEFLKAHAVISRSWLLAQLEKSQFVVEADPLPPYHPQDQQRIIRWYDREDHCLFDVCADDHCQRYQGITRASSPAVCEAVQETSGEVLTDGTTICDARFSKCCGGVTEKFEHCWEPVPHPYLTTIRDDKDSSLPDMNTEEEADRWIRSHPSAWCNTTDAKILSQVLNNYDRETTDFFRWKIEYTQTEIKDLLFRKSGMDFGDILDFIPLKRGTSGRIEELKIAGSKHTVTVGKELEIRRWLSETHLYSSAFVVDKAEIRDNIPGKFILTGAGWGHGVGLCQIGAAVMSTKGIPYNEILTHYYPGTSVIKKY